MRERDDEQVERVANELRRPVRLGEAFDERVMAEIRGQRRHGGSWSRLLRRRTFTLNPALGALAAALVVAVALSMGHAIGTARARAADDGELPAVVPSEPAAASGHRNVQFVLVAPAARKVTVVGDFNDWDAAHASFQAEHRGGGVWSVTAAVPIGHHRYSFVVDDSMWVADPTASRTVDRDFGMPSSTLVVGGEAGR